jgi:hypothetical protein
MSFLFNLLYLVGEEHEYFSEKLVPPLVVVGLVSNLSQEFLMEKKPCKNRKIVAPIIDKIIPLGFFDGASQGHPLVVDLELVLYIVENHYYNIIYTPGGGSNTKLELASLRALLFMVTSLNL